ncbi:MAG: penicillin-binding protein 1C [bacterium]
MRRKRLGRALGRLLAVGLCVGVVMWVCCPPPLEDASRYPAGVILRDRTGQVLRVGLGPCDVDCRPCYRASFDDWIVQAVIASEDKRFVSHGGVDVAALARAAWQNLSSRRRISGASTITMQTVRLIHPHRRLWFWKAVESVQALRLERVWTKEDILSQYLNRAPFGSNLVGIEAASRGWFGKAPQQLNLSEAALLAGLLQSPTRFRPDRYPEAAKARRVYVLKRMEQLEMIDQRACAEAVCADVLLRRAPRPFIEPFFCDWVQNTLCVEAGDHTTTLDPALQGAVKGRVARQAAAHGVDAAAVVLEVKTGAVRAMACSGDYFSRPDGQVNTAAMPRPAGSTLKPFAFALAMDRGLLTPGWVLADVPRRFGNDAPLDFSGSFMGLVTAREALILSLNLPAIEVEERVGQPLFYATLRQLGLDALNRPAEHYGLGLVLGNGSVRLIELASAYACLARGGVWRPCRAFEEKGDPSAARTGEGRRVFSEGASWLVAEMLSGGERAQDAVGHMADVGLPRFAWKTGTSSGFRDAWTVAWNPDYVVAVWCGFKGGQRGPASLVGKKLAAPVVWEVIRHLYPAGGAPWYARPVTVVGREVCAVSGRAAGPLCERHATDLALKQCSSCGICPVHVRDSQGAVQARWPPEVTAFLEAQAHGRTQAPAGGGLRIVSPADGTVYRLVDGMTAQRVAFKVSGVAGSEPLYWFCDDVLEGAGTGGAPFFWTPERGTHRFVCSAVSGAASAVTLRVE